MIRELALPMPIKFLAFDSEELLMGLLLGMQFDEFAVDQGGLDGEPRHVSVGAVGVPVRPARVHMLPHAHKVLVEALEDL